MAIIYKGLFLFFTGGTSCLALSFIKNSKDRHGNHIPLQAKYKLLLAFMWLITIMIDSACFVMLGK